MIQRFVFSFCTLVSLAANSHAVLWYGGDADGRNGLANGVNLTWTQAQTYDDFRVGPEGWHITSAWCVSLVMGSVNAQTAVAEVRQGVAEGSGGELLYSGTFDLQSTLIGSSLNWNIYELRALNLDVNLPAGDYFMNIAPVGVGNRSIYVRTTSGQNAVGEPIGNGNSFFDSSYFDYDFAPASDVLGPGTWDFSFGLDGSPVPEPASMIVLGIGVALLARRRRK